MNLIGAALAASSASTPYKINVTSTPKLITCYVSSDAPELAPLGSYVYCIRGLTVDLGVVSEEQASKLAQLLEKKLGKPIYLGISGVDKFDLVELFHDIVARVEEEDNRGKIHEEDFGK